MRKRYLAAMLAAVMTVGYSITSFAGTWQQGTGENAGKWTYIHDDGSVPKGNLNGQYLEDREGGRRAIYFFDADGWLYTNTTIYPYGIPRTLNADGQEIDENGQVIRMDGYSTSSNDNRLQNIDKLIHKDGKDLFCYSDGTYATGAVWIDPYLTNTARLYNFDSNGYSDGPEETQTKHIESVSQDDSVLRQEGFTHGFSNTAFYILTHTMDETNAKYEIEKATAVESHHSDGAITTTYQIKYAGIPLIASFSSGYDNIYTCGQVDDISAGRNALICDIYDPYSYDNAKYLLEGAEPYYDWIGIGGAMISYSFPGFNPEGYLYVGYRNDSNDPEGKLDIYSWVNGYQE